MGGSHGPALGRVLLSSREGFSSHLLAISIERNARVQRDCWLPSSFTAHPMSCCCLAFSLVSYLHRHIVHRVAGPQSEPSSSYNCWEPGEVPQPISDPIRGWQQLSGPQTPQDWKKPMASPNAGCSSQSGSPGRAFSLLMGPALDLIYICTGNAGLSPPRSLLSPMTANTAGWYSAQMSNESVLTAGPLDLICHYLLCN